MGEAVYDTVVRSDGLARPCRIYAPVGQHAALLPYLVRRLLENGANASFVHRLADPSIPIEELVADPVEAAMRIEPIGAAHSKILCARELFAPGRINSAGFDFADEPSLKRLMDDLARSSRRVFAPPATIEPVARIVRDPARIDEALGAVEDATAQKCAAIVERADAFAPQWGGWCVERRAAVLDRAANLIEERRPLLVASIVREAGRTIVDAFGETREAVDFLRYYAQQARALDGAGEHRPLGVAACISPWNFPLSIFIGQIAAALVVGNCVVAKPAEETPLVAASAVALLHEAGVPIGALQILNGDGALGAALVADTRIDAVLFTGSLDAARSIARRLAERLDRNGDPVAFVAETGGVNAMIVDSSALPEQVVADVIASAFNSAGQRCSSLRLLCVQEDVADTLIDLIVAAARERAIGPPDRSKRTWGR